MPITAAGHTIYASSASISESISPTTMESVGVMGASAAYNNAIPKGSVSFSYYEDGTFATFEALAKNNVAKVLTVGPYTITNAFLNSLSFNGESNKPLTTDQSWDFYGTITEGAPPAAATPTINVYEVASLTNYDEAGGEIAFSFAYGMTQSYEARNYLGNVNPVLVWKNGEVSLEIEGDKLTKSLLANSTSVCLEGSKLLGLVLRQSCDHSTTISVDVDGYMTSRSMDVSAGDIARMNLSIIKYL